MDFWQAIASGFSDYVVFSGRAARSQYWYWILFTVLGGLATGIIDVAAFSNDMLSPFNSIFNILTILPTLAVTVRRLHDVDRSGWWILLLITVIGVFVVIYWACQPGTPGPNRFGADPLAKFGPR
jgi:uncharacterized membrane protein YhaH (DUF805 family)